MYSTTTAATDSSTTETTAAVVASPVSCWTYAQTSGLLDRCTPGDAAIITAAYQHAGTPTGDATADGTDVSSLFDDAALFMSGTSVWLRDAA